MPEQIQHACLLFLIFSAFTAKCRWSAQHPMCVSQSTLCCFSLRSVVASLSSSLLAHARFHSCPTSQMCCMNQCDLKLLLGCNTLCNGHFRLWAQLMMSAVFQGTSHYHHNPSGDYRLPLGPHPEKIPHIGETQNTSWTKLDGRSCVQNTMQSGCCSSVCISRQTDWGTTGAFCVLLYLKTCLSDILPLPSASDGN